MVVAVLSVVHMTHSVTHGRVGTRVGSKAFHWVSSVAVIMVMVIMRRVPHSGVKVTPIRMRSTHATRGRMMMWWPHSGGAAAATARLESHVVALFAVHHGIARAGARSSRHSMAGRARHVFPIPTKGLRWCRRSLWGISCSRIQAVTSSIAIACRS